MYCYKLVTYSFFLYFFMVLQCTYIFVRSLHSPKLSKCSDKITSSTYFEIPTCSLDNCLSLSCLPFLYKSSYNTAACCSLQYRIIDQISYCLCLFPLFHTTVNGHQFIKYTSLLASIINNMGHR